MRFRIVRPTAQAQYQIRLQETVISVKNAPSKKLFQDHKEMVFTWWNGREYTVLAPLWPLTQVQVKSGEKSLCSGHPIQLKFLQTLRRSVHPVFEWVLDGQAVVCEGGRLCFKSFPRSLTLRKFGGKRFASWLIRRGGCEGVLRGDLPDDLKPVILGMVLSGMPGFWDIGRTA
jgi:hypothetical protein